MIHYFQIIFPNPSKSCTNLKHRIPSPTLKPCLMPEDNLQSRNDIPLPALAPKLYTLRFFGISMFCI